MKSLKCRMGLHDWGKCEISYWRHGMICRWICQRPECGEIKRRQ